MSMYEDFEIPPSDLKMMMETPHLKALGVEFVSGRMGRGRLRIPWREDLVGDPDTGVIAGGVVTALLDHVGGVAIRSAQREGFMVATLDLRIDYMRPAAPRAGVTAEAHAYKITRTAVFVRAHAWDEDPDDPIATAQTVFVRSNPGRRA
jgi:uncharacterized protein (TIGR00369 family)